jgi:hypothetical protein
MKEDIIRMAREAGLGFLFEDHLLVHDELERFAALVAERCAEIANQAEPFHSADLIRKAFGVEK